MNDRKIADLRRRPAMLSNLFDDLNHGAGLRIDEHTFFVDDHITVIRLIGDCVDFDRVWKRRTDSDVTFKGDGWRVLFFDIGLDLARDDDRRRLRDRRSSEE
ncbi:hypothetical protein AOG23_29810 [Rhizobium acidisoli]|nr:hypothetical protein AOG23_29810 [Rhizobium acidisoli]